MIRPVFSNDPTQPRQMRIAPVFSSGPMPMPPPMSAPAQPMQQPMPSYGPAPQGSRSLVTGDRSLTRNPGGRAGLPLPGMGAEVPGQRGMTPQRRLEIAARRGDTRASELLYRGPMGFGRGGFGMPPGFGLPPPPSTTVNNGQLPSTPPLLPPLADPLANLEPPATTEQALGMPGFGPPGAGMPAPPTDMRMPWGGLPGAQPGAGMSLPEWQAARNTGLPPSLLGPAGMPPPPEFSMQQVGGFNVLTGPDGKGGSKFLNAYTDPNRGGPPPLTTRELRTAAENNVEPTGQFDAAGLPVLKPKPAGKPDKPNIQWQDGQPYYITMDDNGTPSIRRLKIQDADGDGIDDRMPTGGANGKTVSPFVAAFGAP